MTYADLVKSNVNPLWKKMKYLAKYHPKRFRINYSREHGTYHFRLLEKIDGTGIPAICAEFWSEPVSFINGVNLKELFP